MTKIKIENIMETTFGNGTSWIVYSINNGKNYGYAITEVFKKGDEEIVQQAIDVEKVNPKPMIEKPLIEDVNQVLRDLIQNVLNSDNEMWFVEYDEITKEEIETVQEEVERFKLQEYVTFDEDDCAITIYGGIITEFLF